MIDIDALKRDKRPQSSTIVHALLDRLEVAEKERDDFAQQLVQSEIGKRKISEECDALRGEIEALGKQEPTRDWWDCLIADISAIDCMYRGSPTYAHDAYWMRDHVVWMLKKRRDALTGAKGEEK